MGAPYRRRRMPLGRIASLVVIAVLAVVAAGAVVAFLETTFT
jgi:hypothetical protein